MLTLSLHTQHWRQGKGLLVAYSSYVFEMIATWAVCSCEKWCECFAVFLLVTIDSCVKSLLGLGSLQAHAGWSTGVGSQC